MSQPKKAEEDEKKDYEILKELLKFQCKICEEIIIKAACNSKCGHVFCTYCLNIWHKTSDICPECDESLGKIRPCPKIDQIIEEKFRQASEELQNDREISKSSRLYRERQMNEFVDALILKSQNQKMRNYQKDLSQVQLVSSRITESESNCIRPKTHYEQEDMINTIMNKREKKNRPSTSTTAIADLSQSQSQIENSDLPLFSVFPRKDSNSEEDKNAGIIKLKGAQDSMIVLEKKLYSTYERLVNILNKSENDQNDMIYGMGDSALNNNPGPEIVGGCGLTRGGGGGKHHFLNLSNNNNSSTGKNDIDDLIAEAKDLADIEHFLQEYSVDKLLDVALEEFNFASSSNKVSGGGDYQKSQKLKNSKILTEDENNPIMKFYKDRDTKAKKDTIKKQKATNTQNSDNIVKKGNIEIQSAQPAESADPDEILKQIQGKLEKDKTVNLNFEKNDTFLSKIYKCKDALSQMKDKCQPKEQLPVKGNASACKKTFKNYSDTRIKQQKLLNDFCKVTQKASKDKTIITEEMGEINASNSQNDKNAVENKNNKSENNVNNLQINKNSEYVLLEEGKDKDKDLIRNSEKDLEEFKKMKTQKTFRKSKDPIMNKMRQKAFMKNTSNSNTE